MATASSLGAFLDALRDALCERDGLSGVRVFTGPVGEKDIGPENIVLAVEETGVDQDYPTVPQRESFETYEVEGRIWIVKPGSGESVIKAARDRALEILTQVQSECIGNDTMDGTVRDVLLVSYTMSQFALDAARDCRIAFILRVQAHYTAP
jgi:hypothetical protein